MGRKTLHFHIGSHKTATTVLQNTFATNGDLLAGAGLIYPQAGRKFGAHFPLGWQLLNQDTAHIALEDLGDWPTMLAEVDASPADHAILSSEDFEWINDLERLQGLSARYDVHVVFYMRSPEQYLESYYNQLVKDYQSREGRTLETYMAETSLFFLNNVRILNRWSALFGPENITVRLFDRRHLKGGILEDFMDAIGCRAEIAFREPDMSVLQKVSLPPDALEFIRLSNPHLQRQDGHHRFIVDLVRIAQSRRDDLQRTRSGLLSLPAKRNILRRFAPMNRQVARTHLGSDQSPFPESEASPHPDFDTRLPEADASVMARVAAMIRNNP